MDECIVITVNTQFMAILLALGGALGGCIATLFWQVVKAKDLHIQYTQDVNADLTVSSQLLAGTAAGAMDTVKHERRRTGRAGG